MKVFAFPEHMTPPKVDFDKPFEEYFELEKACNAELKAWLIKHGWSGPNTGEIYQIPHADSVAIYMVVEAPGPRQFHLMHLPYGDAWDSPHAQRVTKKDVLKGIKRAKTRAAFFDSLKTKP